jgi:hypothetical protein
MRSNFTTDDFRSLTTDELWNLRQEVEGRLEQELVAKRTALEDRLRRLGVCDEPLNDMGLWMPRLPS